MSPILLTAHVPPSLGTNHPGCRWPDRTHRWVSSHPKSFGCSPTYLLTLLTHFKPRASISSLSRRKNSCLVLTQACSGHTGARRASSYQPQTSPSSETWSSLLWPTVKHSPSLSFVPLSKPLQAGLSVPSFLTWGLEVESNLLTTTLLLRSKPQFQPRLPNPIARGHHAFLPAFWNPLSTGFFVSDGNVLEQSTSNNRKSNRAKVKTSPKTWIVIPLGSKANPSSFDYHTSSWHHRERPHPSCIPLHIPPMKMSVSLVGAVRDVLKGPVGVC